MFRSWILCSFMCRVLWRRPKTWWLSWSHWLHLGWSTTILWGVFLIWGKRFGRDFHQGFLKNNVENIFFIRIAFSLKETKKEEIQVQASEHDSALVTLLPMYARIWTCLLWFFWGLLVFSPIVSEAHPVPVSFEFFLWVKLSWESSKDLFLTAFYSHMRKGSVKGWKAISITPPKLT